jgi:[ribosomal protein S5]-alanine N-acetyltransferase
MVEAGRAAPFLMRTLRLVLEPISMDDLDAFHRILAQSEVRRHFCEKHIPSIAEAESMLIESRRLFDRERHGVWALRRYGCPDALIGFVGLWPFRRKDNHELGFALDMRYSRLGLATEAGEAMLRYARNHLGWKEIEASAKSGNRRSFGVLARLGFMEVGVVTTSDSTLRLFRRPL